MILFKRKEVKQMKQKMIAKKAIYAIIIASVICIFAVLCVIMIYYKKNPAYIGWKVTQYADASGAQGSFYTLENSDGRFIIIDGGWAANEENVRNVIKQHHNKVDAWIISHPHQDHAGAFNKIYANPNGITVDRIYDSPIDYEKVKNAGEKWDDLEIFEEYLKVTAGSDKVTHLNRGDVFELFGLQIEVFNSYDRYVLDNSSDITNDSSLMFKVSSDSKSMIFCGDIKYQMEDTVLKLYKDSLSCSFIQAAHHGNWSFSEEFYDLTGADTVIFDSPAWIMQDSQYPAYDLKKHLDSRGVKSVDQTTAPNVFYLD